MNELILLPPAAKYIKKIKGRAMKKAFQDALGDILADPYIGFIKKGDLAGIYSYDIIYRKVNYELAYTIIEKKNKKIVVIMAGTRDNFYEQLKRYLK